jgi:hypothetical protein
MWTLFTNREDGVEAAAAAVQAALRAAGFRAERHDEGAGLADIFPDMGEGLAEWTVTSPDGEQTVLQLAYFVRSREPVPSELGPVLSVEDVAGGKVCALASRVEPRDYADTARMLELYTPAELIGLARRLDPGLTGRDFADAGRQLDRMGDERFARYGLSPGEVAVLRERFATRPRTAGAVVQLAASRPAGLQLRPAAADLTPEGPPARRHPDPAALGTDRGDPEPGQ